jgi:hypothetical protein
MERYKSIGLKEREYNALAEKKKQLEATTGRELNWGLFLLLLVGVKALSDVNEREHTLEFHQDDRPMTPEQLEKAGVREVPGIPITLAEVDRQSIAELVITKLGERLKG